MIRDEKWVELTPTLFSNDPVSDWERIGWTTVFGTLSLRINV